MTEQPPYQSGEPAPDYVRLSAAKERSLREALQIVANVGLSEIVTLPSAERNSALNTDAKIVHFSAALSRKPLETIDGIVRRLQTLGKTGVPVAEDLTLIADNLCEIYNDIVVLFFALADGKVEVAASYAADVLQTERRLGRVSARLNQLEEWHRQDILRRAND